MLSVLCLVMVLFVPVVRAEIINLVVTGSWKASDFDVSSTGPDFPIGDPEGDDDMVFGVAPSDGSTTFSIRVDTSSSTGLFSAGYLSNGTDALAHDWIGYTDVTLIGTHTFGSATWENSGVGAQFERLYMGRRAHAPRGTNPRDLVAFDEQRS